jgi:uncharacterized protein (TIGR02147 family)
MIFNSQSVQDFLQQEYTRRVTVNARYSQRAFARSLGMSPGELSEVLRGKRALSLRSSLRVAESLGLSEVETKQLVHLSQADKSRGFSNNNLLTRATVKKGQNLLSLDIFQMVSQWYYSAILALFDTRGFRFEPKWIARRLGITQSQAESASTRLQRLGLVQNNESGQWETSNDYMISPDGIPSEAIRSFHRQMIQLSGRALEFDSTKERNISGIMFACDEKDIPSVAQDISEFLDHVVAKYSKGKKQEVFYLGASFFKVTRSSRKV